MAHLPDVEARLFAHLWRLTTALESLDPVVPQRQLRALDELAEEAAAPVLDVATSRIRPGRCGGYSADPVRNSVLWSEQLPWKDRRFLSDPAATV